MARVHPRLVPSPRSLRMAAMLAASAAMALTASAQQKRVYIANDDHTDYVWNCSEATNRQSFLDMIDYYLDLKDSTAGNPSDYQSRFNCDNALMLHVYQEQRSSAQFNRLLDAIRSGHITAPMTTLVSCYGGTPAEGVIRGMYYAGTLERAHQIRFRLAMAMENQTMPWGLASLWAGSGAQYSWRGVCGCVSRTPYAVEREHEVYWYTGPDGQDVLMKWYSAAHSSPDSTIGGYAEARYPTAAVDYVTVNAPFNGFAARYPFPVIGVFGHGWDFNSSITDEFITVAQQMSNAQRRVIVSNEIDFFQDFESNHAGEIGAVDYSFGNEWELYQSSMAELTARVRRTLDTARTAEAMATVISTVDPTIMDGRDADRMAFNLGMGMYWEHDWTGDGGYVIEKQLLQRRLAGDVERYANSLFTDTSTRLGDLITPSPAGDNGTQFYVFNALSFTRTDAVDLPWSTGGPVHVVDLATLADVPSQLVTVDGAPFLRVLATDVPSVGYKAFEVRPGAGTTFTDAAAVTQATGEPGTQTVTYTIQSDNRDAHSLNSGGPAHEVRLSGYNSGDRHDYVGTDSEEQTAAVQFAIDLPAGTTITNAVLIVQSSAGSSATASGSMRIRMYDVDDAQPFVAGFVGDLVTHHPVASSSVLWYAPSWPSNSVVTSPAITSMVQSFINRPGYAPGKHLGLVIDEGTLPPNAYYGFQDFAYPGGQPARLEVTYQTTGSGGPSPNRVLENSRYRVTVTPAGAVASLIDTTHADRQFAATIGSRAINDLGSGLTASGSLVVENAGPVSVTLRATSTVPIAHTTRITLYRDSDRIDLNNQITQNFGDVRDWAYSFNLSNPTTTHEEVGAIATAKPRTMGGSYATQNARYDYLTLNHFVQMSGDDGAAITLANTDCAFFALGNSSVGFLDTSTPQIRPVAGGRLDGPGLGLPNQGGDSLFTQRFALRTHVGTSTADAMRFALRQATPLVARPITGQSPSLPATEYSFVSIDDPSVLLWALKPAEDGVAASDGGVTARFWSLSETPTSASITAPGLSRALATTHIETVDDTLAPTPTLAGSMMTATFARQQLRTFRWTISPNSCPECAADFDSNGGVDGADLAEFFTDYESGAECADVDQNGGIDGADLAAFFMSYEAGGC